MATAPYKLRCTRSKKSRLIDELKDSIQNAKSGLLLKISSNNNYNLLEITYLNSCQFLSIVFGFAVWSLLSDNVNFLRYGNLFLGSTNANISKLLSMSSLAKVSNSVSHAESILFNFKIFFRPTSVFFFILNKILWKFENFTKKLKLFYTFWYKKSLGTTWKWYFMKIYVRVCTTLFECPLKMKLLFRFLVCFTSYKDLLKFLTILRILKKFYPIFKRHH